MLRKRFWSVVVFKDLRSCYFSGTFTFQYLQSLSTDKYSGIGPSAELAKHNIAQIIDLPVGENYSDHPNIQTFWKVRDRGLSLGDMPMTSPTCDWTAGLPGDLMAWHNHSSLLPTLPNKDIDPKIYDLLTAPNKPHTESFVLYGHIDLSQAGIPNPGGSCFTLANVLVSPTSRGTLTLSSSNPLDAPILDPNLLSNELDTQLLYASGRLTIFMMNSPAAKEYGVQEYGIDESNRDDVSDEAMRKRVLRTGRTLNHGSGTCKMGTVVDTVCRVKGVKGVRVVDASVFPAPLGAHYQAAVYALGEQVCCFVFSFVFCFGVRLFEMDLLTVCRWRRLLLMVKLLELYGGSFLVSIYISNIDQPIFIFISLCSKCSFKSTTSMLCNSIQSIV
jgi:choline dehydrogenase-like flavoprotein